jgi:hypothetical protein
MKASEFIDLMRKAVREEVRSIIKEELKPLKLMVESKHTNTPKPAAPTKQQPLQQTKKKIIPPQIKGIKGPLADILAETYMAMQQEAPYDDPEVEWPNMDEMFTSKHVPPSFTAQQPIQQNQVRAAMTGDPTQAFMKDYSSLLKKADAIANNNRG